MNGAPPPSSAQTSADAAAREREERPTSAAPKRHREWDDEPVTNGKKATTEEGRSRLDEIKVQRHSPSEKSGTPPQRSPSELRRAEDRPSSGYHPSEAAHHPPALPSMASLAQSGRISAPPQEEQRPQPPAAPSQAPTPAPAQQQSTSQPAAQAAPAAPAQPSSAPVYEPAARKMDVDENYDDSGDEEKRSTTKQEGSPKTNNAPAPATAEAQA